MSITKWLTEQKFLLSILLITCIFLFSTHHYISYNIIKSNHTIKKPSTSKIDSNIIPHISPQRKPKLHMVTFATHGGKDDRFCRAIESSIMNHVNITILGTNKHFYYLCAYPQI